MFGSGAPTPNLDSSPPSSGSATQVPISCQVGVAGRGPTGFPGGGSLFQAWPGTLEGH